MFLFEFWSQFLFFLIILYVIFYLDRNLVSKGFVGSVFLMPLHAFILFNQLKQLFL